MMMLTASYAEEQVQEETPEEALKDVVDWKRS